MLLFWIGFVLRVNVSFFLGRFSLRKQSDDASFCSMRLCWVCVVQDAQHPTVFLSAQTISAACWPEVASAGYNNEAQAHSEGTRSHAAELPATNRRRCINCIMNCIYVYIRGSWFSECNHTGLFVYGLTRWRLSCPLDY